MTKLDSVFALFGEPIHHQSALSCFEKDSNVASVRYLVLDDYFWSSMILKASLNHDIPPIPDLRLFSNLEEIFLLFKPLEEYSDQFQAKTHLADALTGWFRSSAHPSNSDPWTERESALWLVPCHGISGNEGGKRTKEWNRCFGARPHFILSYPWPLDVRYWKQSPKLTEVIQGLRSDLD